MVFARRQHFHRRFNRDAYLSGRQAVSDRSRDASQPLPPPVPRQWHLACPMSDWRCSAPVQSVHVSARRSQDLAPTNVRIARYFTGKFGRHTAAIASGSCIRPRPNSPQAMSPSSGSKTPMPSATSCAGCAAWRRASTCVHSWPGQS